MNNCNENSYFSHVLVLECILVYSLNDKFFFILQYFLLLNFRSAHLLCKLPSSAHSLSCDWLTYRMDIDRW